jgi:hypothetical protein
MFTTKAAEEKVPTSWADERNTFHHPHESQDVCYSCSKFPAVRAPVDELSMPDRALLEFKTTPCNTYAATPGGLGTNCSLLSTLAEIRKRISHHPVMTGVNSLAWA